MSTVKRIQENVVSVLNIKNKSISTDSMNDIIHKHEMNNYYLKDITMNSEYCILTFVHRRVRKVEKSKEDE